jgi:hypothetical protein
MELKLTPLNVSKLDYEELAELPGRVKDDIDKNIDKTKMTDTGLNDYLTELNTKGTTFQNGLGKTKANDYTKKVFSSDKVRDKAYSTMMKAIRLGADSDDEAEVEAAESLLNMLKPFGNVPQKNFEAETAALDSILENLADAKYKAHVTKLGIGKYVAKVQAANDAFKALFTTRVSDELKDTGIDMRVASKELIIVYNDTVEYILAMAKNKKNPNVDLFNQLLTVINASRKYFEDTYNRRGK